MGLGYVQTGKDLTRLRAVIGTGGPLVNSAAPLDSLYGVLRDPAAPDVLKPQAPVFHLDKNYILYAMGLLAESHPQAALRMMKKYLPVIGQADESEARGQKQRTDGGQPAAGITRRFSNEHHAEGTVQQKMG
jgi:hypothetical protein